MVNSYELYLKATELMGMKAPSELILPDEERFCDKPRNLTMDCALIEEHGIHFSDSIEGIENALRMPFRIE